MAADSSEMTNSIRSIQQVAGIVKEQHLVMNEEAASSLSYTLCPKAKDPNMVEALFQIGEHFNPAMPENCLGGKVANASPS